MTEAYVPTDPIHHNTDGRDFPKHRESPLTDFRNPLSLDRTIQRPPGNAYRYESHQYGILQVALPNSGIPPRFEGVVKTQS